MEVLGTLASTLLDVAVDSLKDAIKSEIALQKNLQADLVFIKEEFEMMQGFLATARGGRGRSDVVKAWTKQVANLAYDVEYSLIRFETRLEKPPLLRRFLVKLWERLPLLRAIRALPARHGVGVDIKELKSRVQEVSLRNSRYWLIDDSAKNGASAAFFNIENLIRDEVSLLDLVTKAGSDDRDDLQVIAVCCATGGHHGKSSIIREAYEHESARQRFGRRAWVNLTAPFDPKGLLQSIAMQFEANENEHGRIRHADFLEMVTQGRWEPDFKRYEQDKYLLVIDGLSTISEWYLIRALLPNRGRNGSWIIVSTEQEEVATLCVDRPFKVSSVKHESCDNSIYIFFREDYRFIGSGSTGNTISVDTIDEFITSLDESDIEGFQSTSKYKKKSWASSSSVGFKSKKIMASNPQDPPSRLHGRAYELEFLRRRLITEGREQLAVVSVWGPRGIGKTALALSFMSSQTDEPTPHFQMLGFIKVDKFVPEDFFGNLAVDLMKRNNRTGDQSTPAESVGANALAALLSGQRYLIVIDGLFSQDNWDQIRRAWPADEGNGSRIIVTTTAKIIAEHCSAQDEDRLELGALELGPALELFFEKVNLTPDKDGLEDEAKHIVEACCKVPYSVAALGNYLSSSTIPKTAAQWRYLTDLLSTQDSFSLNQFLIATYDSLTNHQRMCFLYLSVFEGHKIRRGRLIRRLIAEGYSRRIQQVATEVQAVKGDVEALIDKGLIQLLTEVNDSGLIKKFCLLGANIHRSALEKSTEENLVVVLDDSSSLRMGGTVKHLAVRRNWDRVEYELLNSVDMTLLQSLTVSGEWEPFFISDKMRCLLVLDLEGTLDLKYEHLRQIGKLLNLKYLSLRGCQTVERLPDSVGHLRRLQTLDIRGTGITKLPTSIVMLQSLQYLRAGTVSVPERVGKLMHLQKLGVVSLSASDGLYILRGIKELGGLRMLGVDGLRQRHCGMFCEAIGELELLQSLSVGLADPCEGFYTMETPPDRLERLKLHGILSEIPEWITSLQKLERLTLSSTGLSEEDMTTLCMLKNLKMLCLCDVDCLHCKICFTTGALPELTSLHLIRLTSAESVSFKEGALPKLELLVVSEASGPALRFEGIEHLKNAKQTFIRGSSHDDDDDSL